MPLLIDQHTGSVTYIETIHGDSFFFKIANAKLDFLKKHLMADLADFMSSYAQEMSNSSKMSEMSNYEDNQEQNDENMTFKKCRSRHEKMSHSKKNDGLGVKNDGF